MEKPKTTVPSRASVVIEKEEDTVSYMNKNITLVKWLKQQSWPQQSSLTSLSAPSFSPPRLLRISDMKIIRGPYNSGSNNNIAYHVLSCPWGFQSPSSKERSYYFELKQSAKKNPILMAWDRVVTGEKSKRMEFLTFEQLVQLVCKELGIRYIWYEPMCNDETELNQLESIYKHAQFMLVLIPQLDHNDIDTENSQRDKKTNRRSISTSRWIIDMWARRHLSTSSSPKKILFVGHDVHLWSEQKNIPHWNNASTTDTPTKAAPPVSPSSSFQPYLLPITKIQKSPFLYDVCKPDLIQINTSTLLWYAQQQCKLDDNVKLDDWIFVLIHLFPDFKKELMFSNINFCDDKDHLQSQLLDVIHQIYRLLAKQSLGGILAFGAPIQKKQQQQGVRNRNVIECDSNSSKGKSGLTLLQQQLPTWTGIHGGSHAPLLNISMYCLIEWLRHDTQLGKCIHRGNYSIDDEDCLRVTSAGIPISIKSFESVQWETNDEQFKDSSTMKNDKTTIGRYPKPIWIEEDNAIVSEDMSFLKDYLSPPRFQMVPTSIRDDGTRSIVAIKSRPPFFYATANNESTASHSYGNSDDIDEEPSTTKKYFLKATQVIPIKKQNNGFVNTLSSASHIGAYLSLTDETLEECIILNNLTFLNSRRLDYVSMPVVAKKLNGRYRSVGICFISNASNCDPSVELKESEFVIE